MTLDDLYKDRRKFIFKINPHIRDYNVSEDLVQDAFLKAFEKAHQFDPRKGSLKGWFTKILFSCVWDYVRSLKKVPAMLDISLVLESDLLAYEPDPKINDLVRAVPNAEHSKVLLAHLVLGYSPKEISQVSGMTQDNVRKITQRFREVN